MLPYFYTDNYDHVLIMGDQFVTKIFMHYIMQGYNRCFPKRDERIH